MSDCGLVWPLMLNAFTSAQIDHLHHIQIGNPRSATRNRGTHPLPQVVLTLVAVSAFLFCGGAAAQAQQSTSFLNCAGTDDNIELERMRASIGTNVGTLKMTAKNGARCAVGNVTIPANITLDNTDGAGITVNAGQTL